LTFCLFINSKSAKVKCYISSSYLLSISCNLVDNAKADLITVISHHLLACHDFLKFVCKNVSFQASDDLAKYKQFEEGQSQESKISQKSRIDRQELCRYLQDNQTNSRLCLT